MNRDQVFISYSRKDKDWLERLRTMLVPLTRAGVKIWADTDIKPGEEWKPAIEAALSRTKVAVLLVSPDFLASPFIHENELPPLLEAAKVKGLTILWVPVRPCYYQKTVIVGYQAAIDPKSPLSILLGAKREAALVEIVGKIDQLMSTPPQPTTPTAPSPSPQPQSSPAHSPGPSGVGLGMKATNPLPPLENIHGWPAAKVQALQQATAQALGCPVIFRDRLKSGGMGPEMLIIPAGEFLMGSPVDEAERRPSEDPQHRVLIAKPFALGRYAVSFEEYDQFCTATGRKKPSDMGWGRGQRPAINLSWREAGAYCDWLSQETGAGYRLPSEAEWEYGARAGSQTAFWWGDEIDTKRANYDGRRTYPNGPRGEYRGQTLPVASFEPNPFGLSQVHGNVWEWVEDGWHEDYQGAPVDGSAWGEAGGGDGSWRVVRGGGWGSNPLWLRSAFRIRVTTDEAGSNLGFRLARTLSFPL